MLPYGSSAVEAPTVTVTGGESGATRAAGGGAVGCPTTAAVGAALLVGASAGGGAGGGWAGAAQAVSPANSTALHRRRAKELLIMAPVRQSFFLRAFGGCSAIRS